MDSVGEELERLARLRASGDLTDAEYELLKTKLIQDGEITALDQEAEVRTLHPQPYLGPISLFSFLPAALTPNSYLGIIHARLHARNARPILTSVYIAV